MSKIKITCDSTCDLTKALYEKYAIDVIPLGISLGDSFGYDGVDITASGIFEYVRTSGQLPKTSAISVGEYMDVFSQYVDDGYQVLHINLSGELSASHQNACIAAQSVGNVAVIDSRSLSSGSGHLVLLAAQMAEAGMDVNKIADMLNEQKQLLDVSFVLQTLDYLHKGGRCSAVAAFGANLMKLRLEIEVIDGKMRVGKKYRGNLNRSVSDYIRGRLEGRTDIQLDRVFITHSGVPAQTLDMAKELVLQLQPFAEVIETTAGSTISSHCGPECLGVLFFRK